MSNEYGTAGCETIAQKGYSRHLVPPGAPRSMPASPLSMLPLARALEKNGFEVYRWGYSSAPLSEQTELLRRLSLPLSPHMLHRQLAGNIPQKRRR